MHIYIYRLGPPKGRNGRGLEYLKVAGSNRYRWGQIYLSKNARAHTRTATPPISSVICLAHNYTVIRETLNQL